MTGRTITPNGERRTRPLAISVRTPTEYAKVPSRRFLCAKCGRMMIEWMPVIKKGMMKGYNRHVKQDLDGKTPKVWLQCPNYPYCPRGSGFRDLMDRTKTVRYTL